ncbi:hypothetical protein J1N35_037920 [Gossypium stocksii]|uniref:Uncharacterized protein n=1 Tax=Gossypium stocksii TaxID=47602 RepID=A0A9D3UKW9_9ROSI|nr:hypothetical protein J1N35_037920 [Gossypium stocksii]
MTWRSTWSAKSLLKSRPKWRIGMELMVSIWEDYWQPGKEMVKVVTEQVSGVDQVSMLWEKGSSISFLAPLFFGELNGVVLVVLVDKESDSSLVPLIVFRVLITF